MSSNFLDNVPNDQKKKLAIIFSAIITVLIFGTWLYFFIQDSKSELDRTSDARSSIWSGFQKNISTYSDQFSGQMNNLKSYFQVASTTSSTTVQENQTAQIQSTSTATTTIEASTTRQN